MTRWWRADAKNKYGVALYNFQNKDSHCLSLNIGDAVHIVEETDEWYLGYVARNKSNKGIFPKAYIQLKEANIFMDGSLECITPKEPLIAQEISSVVREWGSIQMHVYLCGRWKDFESIRDMMDELIDSRRLVLSRKLPNGELRDMQQKATAKIDMGNVLLGLDLVVRDQDGNILHPDTSSSVELYKQHLKATERIQNEQNEVEKEKKPFRGSSFNLYIIVRNFVCRVGEDSDLLMTLYDVKQGKFISENYVVQWSSQGMPKHQQLHNLRALFSDLGAKDRMREKVYLICQIIRCGVMDGRDVVSKKQTQGLRRPFGVAALDVTDIIQGTTEHDEEKHLFLPCLQCSEHEFLDSVIRKLTTARDVNHKGYGLWVSIKVLYGDLKQVHEEHPHLMLGNTAVVRKMGFPEVIMPGDVRNDIYVTLFQGEFSKGTKSSDKNVEVTMHVCNQHGETIPNVIGQGGGETLQSEYKSVVYYHDDKPRWHETIKVAVSIEEEFRGLHLKFSFRHRSSIEAKDKVEKPFAMCFVKLMNDTGTTLSDTLHELLIYRIEKRQDSAAYLELPATRADMDQRGYLQLGGKNSVHGGLSLSIKDTLQLYTLVCSTKLTHNVDLLGLLKWQEIINAKPMLKSHLESIMRVDGEEIVKFLQDLLDSLFSILMQTSSDLYDNLVFDSLVYIIGLVADRKYHQFRPVLDAYIESNFSFAMAYSKLLLIFKDYIDNAGEKLHQDSLLRAMKCMEYIIKLIIRSRLLFSAMHDARCTQQFEISLKQLLQALSKMMMYNTDNTLLVQGAALKYISSTIDSIMAAYEPVDLSHALVDFLTNVPTDRLPHQKLICMDDLVHTEIFKRPDCRAVLLPVFLSHIKMLLERDEEKDGCATVLSDIMHQLHSSATGPHDADISLCVHNILRTVIQTVIATDRNSPLTGEFVAIMLSILRQMTEHQYLVYINSFPTQFDLLDFLIELLMLFQNLVSKDAVFPADWRDMVMLQNSVILRSLRFFAMTIKDKFSNPFESQLWNNFFHCSISFLTQDVLQLQNFTSTKRNKIIERYKDMRREMGFEIRSMWFGLGPNKIHFIPEMVGPFLEMTLIPETELRKATIPIFFDMMHCEYSQPVANSNRVQGNFNQIENEMITQLDALVEGGRGDDKYMQQMCDILRALFEKHVSTRELHDSGTQFVETIRQLLQHLIEYRSIIEDENREHQMSCIVNLLNFYHKIGRQEMYIRYLHKLCNLHLDCDNYTEAAYTLMLYAKLTQWTDDPLHPMLVSEKYPSAQSHRDLKERLYFDVIGYFDKGKMWEKGIELCKELGDQYEHEMFDYERLGQLLRKQADFYDCVMKQMRPDPEYFRVGYYGKGFPPFLQNKVFIYRGKEYERLSDFNARLQNLFPNAQLMRTLSEPGEDILESPNQYLQINAVTPVMEGKEQFVKKRASEQIIKYYKVNDVQTFTYSRPIQENSNDMTTLWLERTNLTTEYSLPGILRWFQVSNTERIKISPLETAVETIEGKNKALRSMLEQHRVDPTLRIDPLGLTLNGVVDPSVNGGIMKYKLFYLEEFLKKNATEKDFELVMKLKHTTLQQLMLVREGLKIHKRKTPDSLKPFHAHMEEKFAELCSILDKDYGIQVSEKIYSSNLSLKRNQSMPLTSINQGLITPGRLSETNLSTLTATTPEASYALLNKHNAANRTQSVWIKPDRSGDRQPDKVGSPSPGKAFLQSKVGNIIRRASHMSSTESVSDGFSRASPERRIALNEQLTPKRPPRPDSDKRLSRHSGHFRDQSLCLLNNMNSSSTSLASSTSTATTDTEEGMDEPPPLPEKQAYADYSNLLNADAATLAMVQQHTLPARIFGKKNKAPPPLPDDDEDDSDDQGRRSTGEYEEPPALPHKTAH